MTIFYIQYHAEPLSESKDFGSCGGAYVNCWIKAETQVKAMEAASSVLTSLHWRIVSTERECVVVDEHSYQETDEGFECYKQVVDDGECYVFNQWPCQPQEGDMVH